MTRAWPRGMERTRFDAERGGIGGSAGAAELSPKTTVGLVARWSRSEARRSLGGPRTRDVVGNYVAGAAGPKGKSQPGDRPPQQKATVVFGLRGMPSADEGELPKEGP
jgi:hypothetical protein